jgi:hypothetical protein
MKIKWPATFLLFFFFWISTSQETELRLSKTENLDVDTFLGIDKFENTYYLKNNSLFKITPSNDEIAFQDLLLGDISRVDFLNPNKIIVFYQMANEVIILDNRLTEIDRQNFNTLTPFKNVSHAGSSKDQSLWIYNIDLNQLELFDYRYDKTIAQSLPIDENIIDLKNNFNFCFIQTAEGILVYNIYGSLLKKIPVENIIAFDIFKNKLIIHAEKGLGVYNQNFDLEELIAVDFEDYDSLFYKDENLYLYNGKILKHYKITTNN